MQDGPTTVFKGEVDAAVSRLVPFPSPLSMSVCMMRKDPRDPANSSWTRGWQLRGLAHLIARLPNQERDLFPPEIRDLCSLPRRNRHCQETYIRLGHKYKWNCIPRISAPLRLRIQSTTRTPLVHGRLSLSSTPADSPLRLDTQV